MIGPEPNDSGTEPRTYAFSGFLRNDVYWQEIGRAERKIAVNQDKSARANNKVRILGIAGSLRSGFPGTHIDALPDTRDGLMRFLKDRSNRRCANSELALMTALWGARQEGAAVTSISLSNYYHGSNDRDRKAALKSLVMDADGLFISSPVYFGANSCLIQDFIEYLNGDPVVRSLLPGKIYSGSAVGAKRNGGQETTLIYQMAEMLNLGFLGVGNNPSTTCQYGGTVVAGNKSAMSRDELGIETCIGAGSRIAQTARIYAAGKDPAGGRGARFDFWILQDRHRITETLMRPLVDLLIEKGIRTKCFRICDNLLQPCKACNRCPDEKNGHGGYQCRIDTAGDEFRVLHDSLLQTDVIVPTLFSPVDRSDLASVYQRFLERTRYLRRGGYMLSNRVVIPLVFCEVGSNEHLDLRLISSLIRHNTILHKPLIGMTCKGRLINGQMLTDDWKTAINTSLRLVAGRYRMEEHMKKPEYIPIGY